MAQITAFKGYSAGRTPTIPKPDHPVDPMILTVQQGVPVAYPNCHGVGVRVVCGNARTTKCECQRQAA